MFVENSLAQFSIHAGYESQNLRGLEREKALQKIEKNFLAYENEVLRDEPVSIHYGYWFGRDSALYTDPGRMPHDRATRQFDPREREGKFIEGFEKSTQLLRDNPEKVVLWYSPPGQACYEKSAANPYSDISFKYGQLYVQYYDGQVVNAVAVKVTEGESIRTLLPTLSQFAHNLSGEKARTYFYLTHPQAIDMSIDEFVDKNRPDIPIYKDKNGNIRGLHEIMKRVKRTFAHEAEVSQSTNHVVESLRFSDLSENAIFGSYMQLIQIEMQKTGKNYIQLAGSCGGKTVTRNTINVLLGLDSPLDNLFSTGLRELSQTSESSFFSDYECPHCKKTLSGESKSDKKSWRKKCDHCEGALGC